MRFRLIWFCFLVGVFCGLGVAGAQDVVGTVWKAPEVGFELRLAPDGTYTFLGAGVSSAGWYRLEGQFLLMQDAANGVQSMYQIMQPSQGILVLTDGSGASLQMTATGVGTEPSSVPSSSGNTSGDDRILASAGGKNLTPVEMQVGYDLVELVIDERLTQTERDRLIAASVQEFSANPEEFLRQIAELRGTMEQLHAIEDPFTLGLARQALFAQFYLATKGLPQDQIPEVIKVMREHLRVVAEDPAGQLVLTDRDLRAMVEYNRFMSQIAGIEADSGISAEGMLEAQLQSGFASLPLETKQTLAAIYPVWQATQYSWAQMTDQQKAQVVMQLRQQQAAGTQTWNGRGGAEAWPPEPNSEWGRTSSGRMALEMMRSANNARVMSSLIDTTAGFTACLTCSPGINPYK